MTAKKTAKPVRPAPTLAELTKDTSADAVSSPRIGGPEVLRKASTPDTHPAADEPTTSPVAITVEGDSFGAHLVIDGTVRIRSTSRQQAESDTVALREWLAGR